MANGHMAFEVTNIQVPEFWQSENDYSSHRPLLWLSLEKTGATPVTEFGCGFGSTPLLQRYCRQNRRQLFSYETNPEWAEKFNEVTLVNDYNHIPVSRGQGVVFIDCAPGELRKELIAKHGGGADVIVVHDSELGAEYVYGLSAVLSTFKYRLDYKPEKSPHTTAVSNFIDLSTWVKGR